MAVDAEGLYQAAQLEPADLGEDIVDPELSEANQRAAAIAYVGTNVLPGVKSEVSIPFREVTGYSTVSPFIEAKYPDMNTDERDALIAEGEALYDLAVKSYGRSEINKLIDSSDAGYDRDSDQDRIQGNQRLEKLLKWAAQVASSPDEGSGVETDEQRSGSIRTRPRLWHAPY